MKEGCKRAGMVPSTTRLSCLKGAAINTYVRPDVEGPSRQGVEWLLMVAPQSHHLNTVICIEAIVQRGCRAWFVCSALRLRF